MKKIPQRECIGCHERKDKSELIRVIRTPEGEYEVDCSSRKNGRGAYLCNDPECLEKAIRQKGLDRSFKEKISEQIYDKLREQVRLNEK